MSELKAFNLPRYAGEFTMHEVYLKSEADKVIAELEDKLRAANEQIENLINSASSIMLFQDRVKDNKCAEIRHHKHKRCLAMAKWCTERIARIEKDYAFWRYGKDYASNFYKRWKKRWLELAEKFKEEH